VRHFNFSIQLATATNFKQVNYELSFPFELRQDQNIMHACRT